MKKIVLAAAISAALSPAAFAESSRTIVITASRTPQPLENVEESTQVITSEEIEQQQATSLPQLLSKQPGLQVKTSGGPGTKSTLYLRGLDAGHILVLVDGVPVGSATSGTASLEHIDPDIIERIEIVRGPKSSLYGGNANAGVIQIFTKTASARETGGSIKAGYGSNNTFSTSLSGTYADHRSQISATVSRFQTDGIDAIDNNIDEDDGYENLTLSLSGSHLLSDSTKISAGFSHSTGNNEYDGCSSSTNDCSSDFTYQVINAGVSHDFSETVNLETRISSKLDHSRSIEDGEKGDTFETQSNFFSSIVGIQATRNISIHTGLDYQNDDVGESTPDGNAYDETSRDNTGVFVSAGFDNNIATAEASVRYDDNESFGDFTTYGLGAGYRINSLVKVNASLATGFKTPTFNDLYYPNYGNPDAEPETYTTKSISATLTPNRQVKAIATLYRTEVDDPLNVNNDSVENGDDSRITGKELTLIYTERNLELAATHESIDPENKESGKDLRFVARQKTTASATYSINQLSAGLDIENVGKRYKDNDNEVELDSYTLVHLNAGYDLQKDLKLAFSVKNVTDENYVSNQTYGGDDYNVEGRTFFGSVRYRF